MDSILQIKESKNNGSSNKEIPLKTATSQQNFEQALLKSKTSTDFNKYIHFENKNNNDLNHNLVKEDQLEALPKKKKQQNSFSINMEEQKNKNFFDTRDKKSNSFINFEDKIQFQSFLQTPKERNSYFSHNLKDKMGKTQQIQLQFLSQQPSPSSLRRSSNHLNSTQQQQSFLQLDPLPKQISFNNQAQKSAKPNFQYNSSEINPSKNATFISGEKLKYIPITFSPQTSPIQNLQNQTSKNNQTRIQFPAANSNIGNSQKYYKLNDIFENPAKDHAKDQNMFGGKSPNYSQETWNLQSTATSFKPKSHYIYPFDQPQSFNKNISLHNNSKILEGFETANTSMSIKDKFDHQSSILSKKTQKTDISKQFSFSLPYQSQGETLQLGQAHVFFRIKKGERVASRRRRDQFINEKIHQVKSRNGGIGIKDARSIETQEKVDLINTFNSTKEF